MDEFICEYGLAWEVWLLWAFLWFGVGQIILITAIAFWKARPLHEPEAKPHD